LHFTFDEVRRTAVCVRYPPSFLKDNHFAVVVLASELTCRAQAGGVTADHDERFHDLSSSGAYLYRTVAPKRLRHQSNIPEAVYFTEHMRRFERQSVQDEETTADRVASFSRSVPKIRRSVC
jgi:hypothetical protein